MRERTGQGVPSRCQGSAALGEGELQGPGLPPLSAYESSGGDNSVAVCVLLLTRIDTTQVTGVLLFIYLFIYLFLIFFRCSFKYIVQ